MEQIPAWFKDGDWLRAKIASAGEKTRFGEVPVPVFEPGPNSVHRRVVVRESGELRCWGIGWLDPLC